MIAVYGAVKYSREGFISMLRVSEKETAVLAIFITRDRVRLVGHQKIEDAGIIVFSHELWDEILTPVVPPDERHMPVRIA